MVFHESLNKERKFSLVTPLVFMAILGGTTGVLEVANSFSTNGSYAVNSQAMTAALELAKPSCTPGTQPADLKCSDSYDYECPFGTPKEKCPKKQKPGGKGMPCSQPAGETKDVIQGTCECLKVCKTTPSGGQPPGMPSPPGGGSGGGSPSGSPTPEDLKDMQEGIDNTQSQIDKLEAQRELAGNDPNGAYNWTPEQQGELKGLETKLGEQQSSYEKISSYLDSNNTANQYGFNPDTYGTPQAERPVDMSGVFEPVSLQSTGPFSYPSSESNFPDNTAFGASPAQNSAAGWLQSQSTFGSNLGGAFPDATAGSNFPDNTAFGASPAQNSAAGFLQSAESQRDLPIFDGSWTGVNSANFNYETAGSIQDTENPYTYGSDDATAYSTENLQARLNDVQGQLDSASAQMPKSEFNALAAERDQLQGMIDQGNKVSEGDAREQQLQERADNIAKLAPGCDVGDCKTMFEKANLARSLVAQSELLNQQVQNLTANGASAGEVQQKMSELQSVNDKLNEFSKQSIYTNEKFSDLSNAELGARIAAQEGYVDKALEGVPESTKQQFLDTPFKGGDGMPGGAALQGHAAELSNMKAELASRGLGSEASAFSPPGYQYADESKAFSPDGYKYGGALEPAVASASDPGAWVNSDGSDLSRPVINADNIPRSDITNAVDSGTLNGQQLTDGEKTQLQNYLDAHPALPENPPLPQSKPTDGITPGTDQPGVASVCANGGCIGPDGKAIPPTAGVTPGTDQPGVDTVCAKGGCIGPDGKPIPATTPKPGDKVDVPTPRPAPQPKDGGGGGGGGGGQPQAKSGGGDPMSALASMLGALAKGLGSQPPSSPPAAPAQACQTDPNAYAQQQQQYQQQLQQYNYQLQQQQYQQQLNQYYANQNGGITPPVQPLPQQPTPCTPSNGSQCQAQPQQPPASACSAGAWRATYSGACISGWQCISTEGPKAELSCEPKVADVGMTLAITYGCSSGTASSTSFAITGQPGGSSSVVVANPPAGTNTATYTLACTDNGRTTGAQCSVQVSRTNIILVANPKTVATGGTSLLSWLTTGMQSCVISSPDQADFTARNSSNTSVTGAATTSPISGEARFQLDCKTLSGLDKQATTTVRVGP